MRQRPVGAEDIPRPDGGADALLPQKRGAREQEDAFAVRVSLPMILYPERMQQREYVGVLRSIADGKLFVAQDGVAHVRPEFFGLCAVEPEGVPSLRKQLAGQPVPVDVARLRAAGIVHMRSGDHEVLRFERLVCLGLWIEQSPDGDHGMHILFVQRVEILRHIVIVGVEVGIALVLPPEPILHHRVQGNVLLAIALRDSGDLVERYIAVLGLEETVSPLGQHRRMTGQVAVLVDDGVHLRAVEEVVVDRFAGHGAEGDFGGKAIVDVGEGRRVPHQPITLARYQQRNCDVGIVLTQFDGRAAVVEHTALMLPKTVEGLDRNGREAVGDAVGALAVHLRRLIGAGNAVSLAQQIVAVHRAKGQIAALKAERHFDLVRANLRCFSVLCELEGSAWAGLAGVEHPRLRSGLRSCIGPGQHVDRRSAADRNVQRLGPHRGMHSLRRLLSGCRFQTG